MKLERVFRLKGVKNSIIILSQNEGQNGCYYETGQSLQVNFGFKGAKMKLGWVFRLKGVKNETTGGSIIRLSQNEDQNGCHCETSQR